MPTKITGSELKRRIENQEDLIILEALAPKYYRKAHIPGALNFPIEQMEALAPSLLPDKNAQIVVYCANAQCENSDIAARGLLGLGYRNVFEYSGGKEEWIRLGYPVAKGSSPAGGKVAA